VKRQRGQREREKQGAERATRGQRGKRGDHRKRGVGNVRLHKEKSRQ